MPTKKRARKPRDKSLEREDNFLFIVLFGADVNGDAVISTRIFENGILETVGMNCDRKQNNLFGNQCNVLARFSSAQKRVDCRITLPTPHNRDDF